MQPSGHVSSPLDAAALLGAVSHVLIPLCDAVQALLPDCIALAKQDHHSVYIALQRSFLSVVQNPSFLWYRKPLAERRRRYSVVTSMHDWRRLTMATRLDWETECSWQLRHSHVEEAFT
jgi:hypothetical protein